MHHVIASKLKVYAWLIAVVFALGLVDTFFNEDEEVEREYTVIKAFVRNNDTLTAKYGPPRSFSSASHDQRMDSASYSFAVDYAKKRVHFKCRIFRPGKHPLQIRSLSEFKSNWEVIKEKFFSKEQLSQSAEPATGVRMGARQTK
ncbi:hypothetical protein [Hymenobacter lapidiphilus]|uniref:Uncharacterized protein n=1 Tax=Hymenobacter lapidiphilus TaxID=2608003 RepID=A0A7Y7PS26_9BACT|nr:hypothetical protein [Hymenobacter lapidiphilus]NVO32870.1 hypothetical protein [Hymenobacter lapidiphilus]